MAARSPHASAEGTKIVGGAASHAITAVVDKTAGGDSRSAAVVRGAMDVSGAVGGTVLEVAEIGARRVISS
jgi:hypothetical protein